MSAGKIRAIITGATGMVGEGVLHECLQHPLVEAVLVINRKPGVVSHPKLKEIVHKDFFNLTAIEDQLKGYNACYFCLGISSVGVKKDEYYKITYVLTMHVAGTLARYNPDMTFVYVSGAGTDSSERGRVNWARVKGKTENDLMKLPFKKVFPFRPGFMKPTKGLKNTLSFYKYIGWLYPLGRAISPNNYCTLREVGLAMIHVVNSPDNRKIITGRDIIELAKAG
ncbi:NAD-dependent epimerase/dehydratase family protein [Paraflavitalea sp. CAU 1676]|uniref:NAD-dependent epimerase/dehydratase family protein n=1 Tax=Paraflavitalea sp. CAU 1676 TaxID=3032598 RepID=UPI0023DCDAF8|nr:NAD-dependent epimerase/dehydratase family protein [Paraflavitalea sp. CAU 1676]MDF2188257.1 NAD-dependent epimerase/dehydratase family protein [Paraflavitalea sp. CAU 1676]